MARWKIKWIFSDLIYGCWIIMSESVIVELSKNKQQIYDRCFDPYFELCWILEVGGSTYPHKLFWVWTEILNIFFHSLKLAYGLGTYFRSSFMQIFSVCNIRNKCKICFWQLGLVQTEIIPDEPASILNSFQISI